MRLTGLSWISARSSRTSLSGSSPVAVPVAVLGLIAVGLVGAASPAMAAPGGAVRFDVVSSVACRDVTPPEASWGYPGERLLELAVPISSFLPPGQTPRRHVFLISICGRQPEQLVSDYEPKTALASTLAGNISVERKEERTLSAGINVNGVLPNLGKGTADAGTGAKSNEAVKYERLPELDVLSAAGTIERGRGVYFKLHPSPQSTLEGGREFTLRLRVPMAWRGDLLDVRCRADRRVRPVVPGSGSRLEQGEVQSFVVAIYPAGDESLRTLAGDLAAAEQRLRREATTHERELQRALQTSPLQFVATALELDAGGRTAEWLDAFLRHPAEPPTVAEQRLPGPVREAVEEVRRARAAWDAATKLK